MAITSKLSAEGKQIKVIYDDKVTGESGTDPILKARAEIEKIRGDIYDMAGKAFQWSGLLTSLVNHIYNVLPDESKDKIDDDTRALIETVLSKCKDTTMVSDYKLEKGGLEFIFGIIEEEAKVATILKKLDEKTSTEA